MAKKIDLDNRVEAYLIMAKAEQDSKAKLEWFYKAQAEGRKVLGTDMFHKFKGRFWQAEETHSFLLALQGYADTLLAQGHLHEAKSYYNELLLLDQEDHLGARNKLFRVLLELQDYLAARSLLTTFKEPTNFRWLYDDLLLSYYEHGINHQLRLKASRAIAHNPLVCSLLFEPIPLIKVHSAADLSTMSPDMAQALDYLLERIDLWNREPSLRQWLWQEYHDTTAVSVEDADQLLEQGNSLLESGNLLQAERLLSLALTAKSDPMICNSLGYCKLLLRQYDEALSVLQAGLSKNQLNPFGYALASECAYYLNDELAAYRYLRTAIQQFEAGFRPGSDLGPFTEQWVQYSVIIKAVAGLLGHDRLVISLHRKWDAHLLLDEDTYQLGVAFFNLGKFQQAKRVWQQITAPEWWFLDKFCIAADKLRMLGIPAPRLEYLPPWYLMEEKPADLYQIEELIVNYAGYQLTMLADLFLTEDVSNPENNLTVLTLSTLGDWGENFSRVIIESTSMAYSWKLAAIIGLLSKGVFRYGDLVLVRTAETEQMLMISEELVNSYIEQHLPQFVKEMATEIK